MDPTSLSSWELERVKDGLGNGSKYEEFIFGVPVIKSVVDDHGCWVWRGSDAWF